VKDYGLPGLKGIRLDTEKYPVIRTAGDLWKGLHEGLTLDPASENIREPLKDVSSKLSEMVAESHDVITPAEAMRRLIAKVAITMDVDQTHVINMEFVEFAAETKKPLYPDVGWNADREQIM